MEINFATGKTEAVVILAGPSTVEARGILADPLVLKGDGISALPMEGLEGSAEGRVPKSTLKNR